MIRSLGLCLVALAAGVLPGRAQEGLYLTWNDCARSSAAMQNRFSGCGSDLGEQWLYCAFTLPGSLDSVVAVEIVVDVQVASTSLPAWWRLDPGGCRDGFLTARADFPGGVECLNMWQGAVPDPGGGLAGFFMGEPRGGAAQARIKIAFAVLPEGARRLEAGTMYYAARLVLGNGNTSTCSGCSEPACMVLNSILIGRLPGAPGGNLCLETPGPGDANRAMWQGAGADCGAVPNRARTWGQIKDLYR